MPEAQSFKGFPEGRARRLGEVAPHVGIEIRHRACIHIAPMKAIEGGIADTKQSSGPDPGTSLEALLPPDMARRGEEIGVRILAGAFIALGGMFATTALAGTGHSPWGPVRVLAGVVFDTQAHGLSWSAFLTHNLLPVTLGNIVGGSILVAAVYWFVYLRGRRTTTPGELTEDRQA